MNLPVSSTNLNRFLLFVTGLGGLLYGIDIGVIDPALSYLNQSIQLSEGQLSSIVAAVLAGSIVGSVFAGMLADWLGRKLMMIVSGLMFVTSVAIIYVSQSLEPLLVGRLLQGMSGGVIAVVVPLYLAECLPSATRGRGTAIFQFLLTVGIVLAAFVGNYYVSHAEQAILAAAGDRQLTVIAADHAWRGMFLAVIYPGILFFAGTVFLPESPRWLVRRGRHEAAQESLSRLRSAEDCRAELIEIEQSLARERTTSTSSFAEIFTQRRYVIPFILACVILACSQATGVNSLLQYMSIILQKAGLDPVSAASYGTAIKIVNSVTTIVAIMLVERKGRVFLLKLGTGGIIVALCSLAAIFHSVESRCVDVRTEVSALVTDNRLAFDLGTTKFADAAAGEPVQLSLLYRYGDKEQTATAFIPTVASQQVLRQAQEIRNAVPPSERVSLPQTAQDVLASAARIDAARHIHIDPDSTDPQNANQPLVIVRASVGPIPDRHSGLLAALCIAAFVAFFSVGPGVCVWLALSELMPTRIRSIGMGVALLANQGVATAIAGTFLPITGNYGFHVVFLFWAGCTVVYFITATFFLPETKGKSLEEIEASFAGKRSHAATTNAGIKGPEAAQYRAEREM